MGLQHWDLWVSSIGIAGVLLAIVLRFTFARKRRASDHPSCRKCGHDLFGLPETSTRCPECGTDLTVNHAVRPYALLIPTRRHWIVRGLLLAMLVLLCWGGWSVIHNPAYTKYKPSVVLVYLTEVTPANDYFAPAELFERIERDELDRLSVWLIKKRAVAWVRSAEKAKTAAAVRTWFVTELHYRGHMEDAELVSLVDQDLQSRIGGLHRQHDGTQVGVSVSAWARIIRRGGQPMPYSYTFHYEPKFSAVDGKRVSLPWDGKRFVGAGPNALFSEMPIPPGEHQLEVTLDILLSTPDGRLLPLRTNHTLSTTITIPNPATTQPAQTP